MSKKNKKQKSNAPKRDTARKPSGPAPDEIAAEAGQGDPDIETPAGDEADTEPGEAATTETIAGRTAEAEDAPVDIEDAPLQIDEPIDETTAEIVSADPAAQLVASGELHAALEALLFTSPEPLSVTKLSRALGDVPAKEVREALMQLAAEYDQQGRGFRIIEASGGFQMATRERFAEYILRLGSKKKQAALSGAMLETLAIIAYRQPVIRAVVESIRGVESSGVVRNLLDLDLIEVVGRKEVIGRPQMYGTTEKFLRAFGLRSLEDLPSIRGLRQKLEAEEAEAARLEREARDRAAADAALAKAAASTADGETPVSGDGDDAALEAPPPVPFDDDDEDVDVDVDVVDESDDE